jgi:hypothetical protein
VPITVAVHCDVALTAIVDGVQAGETEVMVGDEGGGDPGGLLLVVLPPPHAASANRSNVSPKADGKECLTGPLVRWRHELPMWILLLQGWAVVADQSDGKCNKRMKLREHCLVAAYPARLVPPGLYQRLGQRPLGACSLNFTRWRKFP